MNKLSDIQKEEILSLYKTGISVWKVGEALGITGQRVHSFLSRAGMNRKINVFTKEDYAFLKENFIQYRSNGKLADLAKLMGRTKPFICRKAKELGLTTAIKKVFTDECKSRLKELSKGKWDGKVHPRGMLGKKHSDQVRSDMSIRYKKAWADPNSNYRTPEARRKRSEAMSDRQINRMIDGKSNYSRTKKGWFIKGDKVYLMRSSWELNYARYLDHLELKGKIKTWDYEVDSFTFPEFHIGQTKYLPDFKVLGINNEVTYHEVKGWMDNKSKIKLSSMKKYYPKIKIKLIDETRYKKIEKQKDKIKGWNEYLTEKPIL